MILTSCASNKAQLDAAHNLGVFTTAVDLKDQPPECGKKVGHATLVQGEEARIAIRNERIQTDRANDRAWACYVFNKAQIDGARIATGVTGGK